MKRFIGFFVDNPHITLLIMGSFIVFGLFSVPKLKISQNPNVEFPTLRVHLGMRDVSQKVMRDKVAEPFRDILEQNPNIEDMNMTVTKGSVYAWIRFFYSTDIDEQYWDIKNKLTKIQETLNVPMQVYLEKAKFSERLNSFVYAISGKDMGDAEFWARRLRDELSLVRGFTDINLMIPKREVRILLDFAKMDRYNLTVSELKQAIGLYEALFPKGSVNFSGHKVDIDLQKSIQDLSQIKNIQISTPDGEVVYLKELGEIKFQPVSLQNYETQVDNKPAVIVAAKTGEKTNLLTLEVLVWQKLRSFRDALPESVTFNYLYSEAEIIRKSVWGLFGNFLQGVIILLVFLMIMVGYRSTIIITSILPLSIFFAMGLLALTDYGLQQVSVAAFIIALGLIVDNGIVVTENCHLLSKKGLDRKEAAKEGSSSVATALISSTLTTMLAFAPVFFLTSNAGIFLRSLSVTIWLALLASLVVALTFTTLLLSKIGTDPNVKGLPRSPALLHRMEPFRDSVYATSLRWGFKRPFFVFGMVAGLIALSVFWAFPLLKVILLPPADNPYIYISVNTEQGRSFAVTKRVVRKIESLLDGQNGIKSITSVVGNGFPIVNISMQGVGNQPNLGQLFIRTAYDDHTNNSKLIKALSDRLTPEIKEAQISIRQFEHAEPLAYPINLFLSGKNYWELRRISWDLEDKLLNIDGIAGVQNPFRSDEFALKYHIDNFKGHAYQISEGVVQDTLMALVSGLPVQRFRDQYSQVVNVVLGTNVDRNAPINAFDEWHIPNSSGLKIPMSDLTYYTFAEPDTRLYYKFFVPTVELNISLESTITSDEAQAKISEFLKTQTFPPGITHSFSGEVFERAKTLQGFVKYSILILGLIFSIFVLQFRSFVFPLIVFSAIPLSLIGSFWGLVFTRQPLSFLAIIGLTALTGIVVNDSILLVEEAKKLRREGLNLLEASIQAGQNRFMPVLLTSLTTIFGLLPLSMGESLFKPMAIVIIGGLVTSTSMLLFVVPILFYFAGRITDKS